MVVWYLFDLVFQGLMFCFVLIVSISLSDTNDFSMSLIPPLYRSPTYSGHCHGNTLNPSVPKLAWIASMLQSHPIVVGGLHCHVVVLFLQLRNMKSS